MERALQEMIAVEVDGRPFQAVTRSVGRVIVIARNDKVAFWEHEKER